MAEVESQMRLAGISRIDQIAYAIIEPQGPISFIRKDGDELNAGHDPTVT
ncbi:YetF domain-containing protein [Pseudonocardia sp. TMWB2A]